MVGAASRATVRRHGYRAPLAASRRGHVDPARRRPRRSRLLGSGRARRRDLLVELGHDVREDTPPWREPGLFDTFITVWQVGPALYPVDEALMTPLNRELVELARTSTAQDYARAAASLQLLARRIVAFWGDAESCSRPPSRDHPSRSAGRSPQPARLAQLHRNMEFTPFTSVANLTGLPAMSVPLHWSEDGLPIGVQAIGPPAGDSLLLQLAAQIEAARPWGDRRPPLA